ncbi:hypothetical protein ABT275_42450 [Streptomyces sp. NPDC001185]|uniref:hypothetical protein n=1 Tax=Streptomyces sp. NPDC001185 TaxID=3154380 RepID=UPI0033164DEB
MPKPHLDGDTATYVEVYRKWILNCGGTGSGTMTVTVRTDAGRKSAQIVFKKGPDPKPERKDGRQCQSCWMMGSNPYYDPNADDFPDTPKLATWQKVVLGAVCVVAVAVAAAPVAVAVADGCLAAAPVCAAEIVEAATGGASGGSGVVGGGALGAAALKGGADDAAVAVRQGPAVQEFLTGGFKVGVSPDEIADINRGFGGEMLLSGSPENALTNASRYNSFWDKSAVVIRDIAGSHMFNNGNKRTAQATVEQLMQRNGVTSGPTSADLRSVIDMVGKGQLHDVSEISAALRGY